ncbi:protein O-mannosyl-transferase TMTC2 isoform X2 [Drosophila novamexicana]|uniref:protein O-mannosyl-transferase TMTC2 isoform X2 n=1 Tax=Drosophila novamexicana TaxID=47314 RepID=UPI0011E5E3BF|nr:protein O-mannosyl-transferase TMTC2 isoform X2 [Drosophila novamexicana]
MKSQKKQRAKWINGMDYTTLLCCGLAFVLYLNTLNAGFVYDDRRAILANADVSGGSSWQRSFGNDFWGTPLTDSGSHGSWRPLCVLSFRLNYLLAGGFAPWGFHLGNNLLHCVATALVVRVARTLLASFWAVLAAGALFAAHPIHTEAVAGVVGRADVAACVCYLLTYLSYLRHMRWRESADPRQWLALATTLLFALAALLCKETAITALLVCAAFDVMRGLSGQVDKQRLRSLCFVLGALGCSVYYRLVVVPGPQSAFSSADNPIARTASTWTRLLTFLHLPVVNLKLLLQPQVLSFDWGMDALPRVTTIWDRRNAQSACFYTVLLGVAWRGCKVLLHSSDYSDVAGVNGVGYPQYHIQKVGRKSRAKRKRLANNNNNNNNSNKYQAFEAAYQQTALPYAKQPCSDCNNNNSNGAYVYGDQHPHPHTHAHTHSQSHATHATHTPHQLVSSAVSLALHKAFRGSRSSSSCSNSTTASNKSSGSNSSSTSTSSNCSTSSCSSSSSSSGCSSGSSSSTDYMLGGMSVAARNACILLMSCAFLTLPFLPASNLFFYVGFVVAERLLYLPSVGFCLLVGYGVSKLLACGAVGVRASRTRRLLLLIGFSVLLVALCVRTVRRNADWRDEESLFRSAINVNPPKALGNLGSVLSSQARYEEAKQVLQEAIRYRPNMADVHFNLGILHQNQQDYKSAVECFQRAIKFRPSLAVAYLNLGISFIALGKRQQAIEILQVGATLEGATVRDRSAHDQARSSAYLQLGALYVEQGKLQRALAVYREALSSLPTLLQQREVLYQRIGDVFGRLQQWDEAERHHRAALELQPNQVAAHISYGITLARNSSRASEAEMWFKRALKLAPEQASVYHHYAEFLALQSRHHESAVYHRRAAELAPADYALVVAAATSLRLLDRKVEAELWYRKAVALRPDDAHAHTNLGAILHLLGRTNHAAASYKAALRLQPGDAITLGNLAKLGVTNV